MRTIIIPLLTMLALSAPAQASVQALIGNTLECEDFHTRINHGAIPGRDDWRSITLIYFTSENMFMQSAGTKEMATGKIHTSSGGGLGQVFQWGKRYSGKVGLRDTFKSYATKGPNEISYEIEYTAYGRFADNVTMIVFTRGRIHLEGSEWRLSTDARQRLAGRGKPAVHSIVSQARCTLKEGRHLQ